MWVLLLLGLIAEAPTSSFWAALPILPASTTVKKYFICLISIVVEAGSIGKAAQKLDVGASAISQQISKLEQELSIRLLLFDFHNKYVRSSSLI
jgi:hypothetical protein